MNLSLVHGWITLLPLQLLGPCQVRWRSRRTLQRDTLGKKRVFLCFLWVCSGWESLTVSFTSLLFVLWACRMWADYEWSQEWLDSCICALAVFIALGWQLGRGELYIPAVAGLVQGSGCGKSPLKNRVVWVEHAFPTTLFRSVLCAWICTGGLCLVCWLSSGIRSVERLAAVGAWTSWVDLCIPSLQQAAVSFWAFALPKWHSSHLWMGGHPTSCMWVLGRSMVTSEGSQEAQLASHWCMGWIWPLRATSSLSRLPCHPSLVLWHFCWIKTTWM